MGGGSLLQPCLLLPADINRLSPFTKPLRHMNFKQSVALSHCHVKQNTVLLEYIYEYKQELTSKDDILLEKLTVTGAVKKFPVVY